MKSMKDQLKSLYGDGGVEDTSKRTPIEHIVKASGEGLEGYITGMEKAGQTQLVTSSLLPVEMLGCADKDLEALGFKLGPVVVGDPLFRVAELPKGWARRGSDHDMWSYIDDEKGLERVAVFYKAAFYDRKAHMRLSSRIRCVRDYGAMDADGTIKTDIQVTMPVGALAPRTLHTIIEEEKFPDLAPDHPARDERYTRKYIVLDEHRLKVEAWITGNHPDPAKHWDL